MNSLEAIKNNIMTSDMVCGAYLGDLTNEEFMNRPHPGCNHINWQVGHLISADNNMCNGVFPGTLPDLPEGFAEQYSKESTGNDDPAAFVPGDQLKELAHKQRDAIVAKLESLCESDLDAPAPESMQAYAPNVGAVMNMLGSHWMMHAGQWVIVRRQLGREVVI